jgi:hypothetical protein
MQTGAVHSLSALRVGKRWGDGQGEVNREPREPSERFSLSSPNEERAGVRRKIKHIKF